MNDEEWQELLTSMQYQVHTIVLKVQPHFLPLYYNLLLSLFRQDIGYDYVFFIFNPLITHNIPDPHFLNTRLCPKDHKNPRKII